jgi:hypothetical protein
VVSLAIEEGDVMPEKKPQLLALTTVGFAVNSAIEDGDGDVSFDDVYKSLEQGRLLEMLDEKVPNQFDFSLFKPGTDETVSLNKVLFDASAGLQGRERRKSGIEKSGLHLVMALILEAIQRHDWVSDRSQTASV